MIQLQITPNMEVKKDDASVFTPSVGNRSKLLTKPAKVPTWTQDLTLETFSKQLQTWSDILEEIPEYVKYQDLMKSLKANKEIKGLLKYVAEHILPILERKTEQTMKRVLEILALKFGCTRTQKIEDFMADWTKFRDNQYDDDGELLLGMKELNQRRKELKMTEDELVAVWML